MTVRESALLFPCEGEELVGLISEPQRQHGDVGVLIVVGGPQYRVGSHRQFVLLARYLAESGVPCMRFDYRGMGDATGAQCDFEDVGPDLRAAIDAFVSRGPEVRRVVLWGLCDGASAACFYAPTDERVIGMVLLNPWVKTPQGEARTRLRHYYVKRLLDRSFWRKLLSGGVSLGRSMGGVVGAAKAATVVDTPNAKTLPERMEAALARANKPLLVVLSGRDYVAREFEQAMSCERWKGALAQGTLLRVEAADHTFSTSAWRDEVARATLDWVRERG